MEQIGLSWQTGQRFFKGDTTTAFLNFPALFPSFRDKFVTYEQSSAGMCLGPPLAATSRCTVAVRQAQAGPDTPALKLQCQRAWHCLCWYFLLNAPGDVLRNGNPIQSGSHSVPCWVGRALKCVPWCHTQCDNVSHLEGKYSDITAFDNFFCCCLPMHL